ncbi:Peptidoglycan/LPS O-acetylase OafA/YrhL, contains acyltransferase and SGNH-hydrolase domains [Jannaschia faecimaris]|uniref:Peptidoglycan/LPS O-acetylase OafA/YrhL, contains acyltransferase and SGNH-hydrolase domains n=1 Tax=Jannaschia faecimaris TaxID=1244108 RepID=A0A1H3P299_9RHOB|nr:Peptidoglycan/LPS O-acetylase OafA/YrhL, contains acyltransferase and SGNH-hydrolase domains [Jannaschia faecimaris]
MILFHADVAPFSGGFFDVDVFFVLSGFLITTLIQRDLARGSLLPWDFYERRARRILPALFAVISVRIVVAWFIHFPADMENFSESVMGVALFLSNTAFWDQSGYFDTAAELKPLLHTWSRAVEEQFYIFFPLLLMGFWHLGMRVVTGALAVIFLASLTYAQWAAVNAPNDAFFFILSRAWELLIGSFAAIALAHWPALPRLRPAGLLSAVGLICVIIFIVAFDDDTPTPGLWFLLPTGGTALILLFSVPGAPAHRILSLRPMVWVGLISYSAYLWHRPLFVFTRYSTTLILPVWVTGLLLAATVFLGWLSYLFIETPFRNRTILSRRTIFKASGTGLLVMLVPARWVTSLVDSPVAIDLQLENGCAISFVQDIHDRTLQSDIFDRLAADFPDTVTVVDPLPTLYAGENTYAPVAPDGSFRIFDRHHLTEAETRQPVPFFEAALP